MHLQLIQCHKVGEAELSTSLVQLLYNLASHKAISHLTLFSGQSLGTQPVNSAGGSVCECACVCVGVYSVLLQYWPPPEEHGLTLTMTLHSQNCERMFCQLLYLKRLLQNIWFLLSVRDDVSWKSSPPLPFLLLCAASTNALIVPFQLFFFLFVLISESKVHNAPLLTSECPKGNNSTLKVQVTIQ